MTLHILAAPSGFKESLDATAAADAIARGARAAVPDVVVRRLPLVDGGEGFTRGVATATGGDLHAVRVTGPVGQPVEAVTATFTAADGARVGVVEMAAAAGLRLVPDDARDPGRTTTRGVGELVADVLDRGIDRLLVGCGDSGTNDGGAGMASALGARLLDATGRELADGGSHLADLAAVDTAPLDPRLADLEVEVACNPHNVLCGPAGVARVFGPQKGATPAQVDALSDALETYATVVERDTGVAVAEVAGGGASGGLGAGLLAFLGARLRPRFEVVDQFFDLDGAVAAADLVVTAEGSLDRQTPSGKVPAEVAGRAADAGVPCIALAGTVGPGARAVHGCGVDAYVGILRGPCDLAGAIARADDWLADAAEEALRMVLVGQRLPLTSAA